MWIYQNDDQLVLESERRALVLHTPEHGTHPAKIKTSFVPSSSLNIGESSDCVHMVEAVCCLGLIKHYINHFVVVVTATRPLDPNNTSPHGLQSVQCIDKVHFFCLGQSDFSDSGSNPLHPMNDIHNLLTAGQSYVALDPEYDLTRHTSAFKPRPAKRSGEPPVPQADAQFVANAAWLKPFTAFRKALSPSQQREYDQREMTSVMVDGFFGQRPVTVCGESGTLSVISRRGWRGEDEGRGIDSDGNAADYAETETILQLPGRLSSFVQVRGSAPVFWTDHTQNGAVSVEFVGADVVRDSASAARRHFFSLLDDYSADSVMCLDLLNVSGSKDERKLQQVYEKTFDEIETEDATLRDSDGLADKVHYFAFDWKHSRRAQGSAGAEASFFTSFHDRVTKSGLTVLATSDAHAHAPVAQAVETLAKQHSIWRVSARDCIDRTNLAQNTLSAIATQHFVYTCYKPSHDEGSQLEAAHRQLFADNGDALSQIAVGAPAASSALLRGGTPVVGESVDVKEMGVSGSASTSLAKARTFSLFSTADDDADLDSC